MAEPPHTDPPPLVTGFRLIFGLVVPAICVITDPAVFRSHAFLGPGFLQAYRVACWFTILLEGVALSLVFLGIVRSRVATIFFSGVLFAGAVFSLALGVTMLPLSVIGLLMMIGILGFAPFLTALACYRTATALARRAPLGPSCSRARRYWLLAAGFLAVIVPAVSIQAWIEIKTGRVIQALRSSDQAIVDRAMSEIDRDGFFLSGTRVAAARLVEPDEAARGRLERGAEALGIFIRTD